VPERGLTTEEVHASIIEELDLVYPGLKGHQDVLRGAPA
jgi:hypothetical protein